MAIKPVDASQLMSMVTKHGLALGAEVTLLPSQYPPAGGDDARLVHSAEASTVVKIFRQAGLATDVAMLPSGKMPSLVQQNATWIGPTIFISAMCLSQNPHAVSLALSVLGNYLTDLFRGKGVTPVARFTLVREDANGYRGVEYEGPVSGIAKLKHLFGPDDHA